MASYLQCKTKHVAVDGEGYLKNLSDWDEEVASCLAEISNIKMTDAHWEVIRVVRKFYSDHQLSPPMRAMVKLVQREFGNDKGRSVYLMKLFGGSAAKTANKLAGLPRPSNCI
jgi:tRNA 2-thiouridine synthesizing protein E